MRVLIVVLVTGENKVNSYSDQLKLGQVCKFGVEFDKKFDTVLDVYALLKMEMDHFRA